MGSSVQQLTSQEERSEIVLACHLPCSSSPRALSFNYWDLIPDALVAKILALLPFSSIYLARGVCKRWRTTIWSPLFLSFLKMRPFRMPWLLEFHQHMYNQSWAFDLEGCQWFHLNFFFLPETAIVLATAGGLVCLGRMAQEGYVMYVCNPLTKDWKKLPPIALQPDVVLMHVDRQSCVYKIIALVIQRPAGVGFSGSVFVFNGKTGQWRETPYIPEDVCAGNLWDATVSGSVLYCLSTEQRMEAFDTDRGFWSPCRYPNEALARIWRLQQLTEQESSVLENSYLCDRRGHVCMITPHQNLRNMFIIKFDPISRTWRLSHVSAATGSVICAGRFSSLSVSMPHIQGHVYLMHAKGSGRYNSTSKCFQHLPRSPLTRHKPQREEIFVKGLWYEPRLDATV